MQKLSSILLVDDDLTTNFLNELLLESLGVAECLFTAENGEQALGVLATQTGPAAPTLILLDVHMPGMNGIEFLEAYRLLPAAQRTATVIMLTTSVAASDLARLQELNIAGLVSKPLTREKVDEILQRHFPRQLPN